MATRLARHDELPAIAALLRDDSIDLAAARVFVDYGPDGNPLAVLPLRLVWIAEPLVVAGRSQVESGRAAVRVYQAAEEWIASLNSPVLPPRWMFVTTRARRVKQWAGRLGWRRLFQGAAFYVKHLPRR